MVGLDLEASRRAALGRELQSPTSRRPSFCEEILSDPLDEIIQQLRRASGRPRLKLKGVGARWWIRDIQEQTGCSLGELDRRFPCRTQARTAKKAASSRRLHRAARGEGFPIRAKTYVDGREILLVDALETVAPGSKKKLVNQLWPAYDYALLATAELLWHNILDLPRAIRQHVLLADDDYHGWLMLPRGRGDSPLVSLAPFETVDRLAGLVLWCRAISLYCRGRTSDLDDQDKDWPVNWNEVSRTIGDATRAFLAREQFPKEDADALMWAAAELFPTIL